MRDKKFIITIGIVCALNLTVIFSCFYLFSLIQKESVKILDIHRQISLDEARMAAKSDFKNNEDNLAFDEKKLNAAFLTENNIVHLIESFEFIASQAGVSLALGSINMEKKVPQIQLSVKGKFANNYHYLVLLENLAYCASVEKFYSERQIDGAWKGDIIVSINCYLGE